MSTEPAGWRSCSSCKGDIGFEEVYYLCSVSTCNRKGTDLRFCSVECWDVHVPVMRHRDAWAVEERSPTVDEWKRHEAEEEDDDEAERSRPQPAQSEGSSGRATGLPAEIELNDSELPRDVLVVVSKLKAYVRARSGMNTSDGVVSALSSHLRRVCDEAIRTAARNGRKTVLDRDFSFLD